MPRPCSVCSLDAREAVDAAIVAGVPYRDLVAEHDVSMSAVSRHKRDHLSPALASVVAQRHEAGAESALERIEGLYARAVRVLDAAEADGKSSLSLAAIREVRSLVELLAKITGELDESTRVQVLNVQTSSEWQQVRGAMVEALAPYPEAAQAVSARLTALEPGGGS